MFNQYCPLCNKDLSSFKTKFKLLREKILNFKYELTSYSCNDCEIHFKVCNTLNYFRVQSFLEPDLTGNYSHIFYTINNDYLFFGKSYRIPKLYKCLAIDLFACHYEDLIYLDKNISLQEAAKVIKNYKENLLFL